MKWIKDNWFLVVLLLILAFVAWRYVESDTLYEKLLKDYNSQAAEFEKERQQLEEINQKHLQKQKQLIENHKKALQEVEDRYTKSLGVIEEDLKAYKKRLVANAKKDPSTLTKEITETFGIPLYKPNGPSNASSNK